MHTTLTICNLPGLREQKSPPLSNIEGCLYQGTAVVVGCYWVQRTVTLNLPQIERSIKQHGHCKKDCSYFERSSADSWRVQVYFLLIRPIWTGLYIISFCGKRLLALWSFLTFRGISKAFWFWFFVELILQIQCKVVLINSLFISSELFSSLLFNITWQPSCDCWQNNVRFWTTGTWPSGNVTEILFLIFSLELLIEKTTPLVHKVKGVVV